MLCCSISPPLGVDFAEDLALGRLDVLDGQLSQSASRMIAIQPELSFSADDGIDNKLLILGLLMMAGN